MTQFDWGIVEGVTLTLSILAVCLLVTGDNFQYHRWRVFVGGLIAALVFIAVGLLVGRGL